MKEEINGTLIAWDEVGQGKPLVLIHGLSETRAAWRYQLPQFQERFRLISYDIRGFGESETGRAEGRPEQLAKDLAALLSRLEIARAYVLGFSMGGVIAQRFAIDYPEMALGLVIASSSSVVNRQGFQYLQQRASLAESGGLEAVNGLNRQDAPSFFVGDRRELVEGYLEIRLGAVRDVRGYINACRAMASLYERPLTEELRSIACPALAITGEHDTICPPKASQIIQGQIPGCRLCILPAAGHLAHWENSAAFNDTVLGFLASLDPEG